jgi:hypothetical protein
VVLGLTTEVSIVITRTVSKNKTLCEKSKVYFVGKKDYGIRYICLYRCCARVSRQSLFGKKEGRVLVEGSCFYI